MRVDVRAAPLRPCAGALGGAAVLFLRRSGPVHLPPTPPLETEAKRQAEGARTPLSSLRLMNNLAARGLRRRAEMLLMGEAACVARSAPPPPPPTPPPPPPHPPAPPPPSPRPRPRPHLQLPAVLLQTALAPPPLLAALGGAPVSAAVCSTCRFGADAAESLHQQRRG